MFHRLKDDDLLWSQWLSPDCKLPKTVEISQWLELWFKSWNELSTNFGFDSSLSIVDTWGIDRKELSKDSFSHAIFKVTAQTSNWLLYEEPLVPCAHFWKKKKKTMVTPSMSLADGASLPKAVKLAQLFGTYLAEFGRKGKSQHLSQIYCLW